MDRMFVGASAFEQDLDWCTLATVDSAFLNSPCELKKDCVLQCPSFPFFCLFSDLFDLFSVAVTLRRRPWRGAYGRAIRSGPQTPSARPHGVAYARRRRPARSPCRGPGGARSVRAREDAGADARPGGASLQRRPLRRAEVPKSRFLSATGPNSAGPRCVRRLQVHYEEG